MLGVKIAASTVLEIRKQAGLDASPVRASTTWADPSGPWIRILGECSHAP